MPKFTFMGWNTVTDWIADIPAQRADSRLRREVHRRQSPAAAAAVSTPTRKPEAADST
jgi:hypothetical protein